jgi:hypothetical protein
MAIDRTRHGRQIRLPEIGEAGQERLGAAEVTLRSTAEAAREVEAAYLRAAGIRVARNEPGSVAQNEPGSVSLGVRDPAARDVAEGALNALVAMRRVLGVGGAS